MIELTDFSFWAFCGIGALLFFLGRTLALRPWLLAAVNAAFVGVVLRQDAIWIGAGLTGVYLWLRLMEGRVWRLPASVVIFGFITLVFVVHKLQPTLLPPMLIPAKRLLAAVGYSYVALRLVEVTRAVFEGRHRPPNLASLVNYAVPFHMLAAGPIQSFDDFMAAPSPPAHADGTVLFRGIERIAQGLFKKFVLALLVQKVFLTGYQTSGAFLFIEVQAAFIWLYLDFSAYSDIAVGVGSLIGVRTPENFARPIGSRNIVEFWERWHISLSLFIRRNVFIPVQLLLMRRTAGRHALLCVSAAITAAFVLCGLWHGFTDGCLIWGLAQAGGLITVRIYSQFLRRRMGADGLRTYLANPWIRIAAAVLTFEFEAWALVPLLSN